MTTKGLPLDWQEQAMNAMSDMRTSTPGEAVFGLRFPAAWQELSSSARNGDIQRLLGVKVVTFGSDRSIERVYPPGTKKADEKLDGKPKGRK